MRALLSLAAVCLLVAACGSDDDSSADAARESIDTSVDSVEEGESESAATEPPESPVETTDSRGTNEEAEGTTSGDTGQAPLAADNSPSDVSLRPVLPLVACPVPEETEEKIDLTVPGAELLPTRDGQVLCVGPVQGTGDVFERGSAELQAEQGWSVDVDLREEGEATWNALATQCFNGTPTCPRTIPGSNGQLAIVLDGVIQSAPSVNQPTFDGAVSITGDFSEAEARLLVDALNEGLPQEEAEADG